MTLIKKIVGYTTPIFFVMTFGIFGLYNYMYYSTIPSYKKKLTIMAQDREQEINNYLNKQEEYAIELSQQKTISEVFLSPSSNTSNINIGEKDMDFKNIFLIDKNGNVIFSTTQKNIIGTNIYQDDHSSLHKSYERAVMALTNDFSNFNFNQLLQEPALFITIPILKEKKFIGALAYQLDQEKIYRIAHQYIGLEKTGEVVLACKDESSIVFVAPTRNDPDLAFKKRPITDNNPLAIQASILGQEGSGIATDYRGQKIVGAWRFIPKLDWGIMIKIDHDEIEQPATLVYTLFLLALALLLLSFSMDCYLFYPQLKEKIIKINKQKPFNKIPNLLKNPFFITFLLFFGLTIKNSFQYLKNKHNVIVQAQKEAIEKISTNSETIQTILEKITFIGQSIAHDLQTQYLKQEDINTRINRDLAENNILTKITILSKASNGKTSLYVTNSHKEISNPEDALTTNWYTQAREKGSVWLINKDATAIYACSFNDENNQSQKVIAITFSLKKIVNIVTENSSIGQTGYGIIMTNDGTFIYHPLTDLAQTETTLLQYAQSQGNNELASIAQRVIMGKPVMAPYFSEISNDHMWIYTHPITTNNWIIGCVFPQEEISLPSKDIRHYYFWILIWMTITLLLLCALFWRYAIFSLTDYAIIANIILMCSLMATWYIIKETTTTDRDSNTVITSQSALNKFLHDLDDEAERKHEAQPINIPCGILLYSLSYTGSDTVTLSGYLWNKYNTTTNSNIVRGMDLPQATRMVYGTPVTSKANHEETSTWGIQGLIYQDQKYEKFPFDQQQLRIILEHKDIEKNIILTPDLAAYRKISPESTPGLDKEFSLSGFIIEQAFFEYQKVEPKTNFGFKEYGKVTDNYHLIYNAIINRKLINPFIIYVLPLLVILFTLFTTLLVTTKTTSPLSILGGYSGLFFALIVLQRSLREQYPSGSTLYMEYAFFYTYITIILLIVHTILMYYYKRWESYQNKSLYFMRILFWPFQWITWLITTLIIFY